MPAPTSALDLMSQAGYSPFTSGAEGQQTGWTLPGSDQVFSQMNTPEGGSAPIGDALWGQYQGLMGQKDAAGNSIWGTNGPGFANGQINSSPSQQTGSDYNGSPYTNLGASPGDWLQGMSANGATKGISGYNKDNIGAINDPARGWIAPSNIVDPLAGQVNENWTQKGNSGFWNGMGPWALGLSAFGGAALSGLSAGAGIDAAAPGAEIAGGGGAGSLGGGAAADTLDTISSAADLGLPATPSVSTSGWLQSIPGISTNPGYVSPLDTLSSNFAGGAAAAGGAAGSFADSFQPGPLDTGAPGMDNPLQGFPDPNAGASQIAQTTPNLSPEMLQSGVPAAGTEAPMSFMDQLQSMIKGYDPSKTLLQQLLGKVTGNGTGQGASGLFGNYGGAARDALSIGSGLYGMSQSQKLKQQAQQASQQADPFGPYRGQFAQQLSALGKDPSSITSMPGYGAGLQAVERRMASQGFNGSGNMMTALSKYGGDFYNNAISQLSGLSGAQFNPASGAALGLQGNTSAINLASQSLASLGYGLGGNTSKGSDAALLARLLGMAA